MSLQEMEAQIPQLTFEERRKLIRMLESSLREESQANAYRGATAEEVRGE
jgi:ribosome recycling factor